MEEIKSTKHTPQLPRYRRTEQRAVAVAIQPRDLLLLKAVYDFPYCTAAQLSRLLPEGVINPKLRAYHDQRLPPRGTGQERARTPVRREVLRRLQQLFHAAGGPGPFVQRHKVDNNSAILYSIAHRAVDILAAEFDLDTACAHTLGTES